MMRLVVVAQHFPELLRSGVELFAPSNLQAFEAVALAGGGGGKSSQPRLLPHSPASDGGGVGW